MPDIEEEAKIQDEEKLKIERAKLLIDFIAQMKEGVHMGEITGIAYSFCTKHGGAASGLLGDINKSQYFDLSCMQNAMVALLSKAIDENSHKLEH